MASKNEARFTFTADTKEFSAAIKSADSQMKQLRSELKLNEAQMKNTGQTVDALTKQKQILESQEQTLSQKVEALNGKYERACQIWGENSNEAQRFAVQINGVLTAQERIRGQIDNVNQSLREQSSEQSRAQSAYGQLSAKIDQQRSTVSSLEREYTNAVLAFGKTSTEAKQLETRLSQANSELQESERQMSDAERAAKELARGFDDAGDAAKDMGSDIGDIAAGNLLADFASDAISSLTGLVESTQDYRNEQNKLKSISIQSGQSLDLLTGRYQDLFAITGDSTVSSTAVANMSAMGLSVEETNSLVSAATGIWAKFGDSIPLDGLMEAINETSVVGTVTGNLADALNWAGISEDGFNAKLQSCGSTQERQQLIIDALNGKYGDLAKTYAETNSGVMEVNRANDNLTRSQSELAEKIAPLQADLTNLAANGIGFLADNLNWIVPIVGTAAGAFVALKGAVAIQSTVQSFSTAIKTIPTVLGAATGPIGIVVAALSALIALFTWGYQNVEPFRNAIDQLVLMFQNTFGPIIQQVGSLISQWLTSALTYLGEVITTYVIPFLTQFGTFLTETVFPVLEQFGAWFVENIIPVLIQVGTVLVESVFPIFAQLVSWFAENIIPILQQFWDFAQANIIPVLADIASFIVNQVVPAIGDMFDWFSANIIPILQQFWNFVQSNILPIFSSIADFILGTVVPALQSLFGWFSDNIIPIFEDTWGAISEGIGMFEDFASTVGGVIDDVKSTVGDGLEKVSSFFSGLKLELPHIKLPHFSIEGTFSLNPPSIPHIGISWYAEGGIMNKPMAFGFDGQNLHVGGEAGPEVIAPLDRLSEFLDSALDRYFGGSIEDVVDAIEHLADRVTVLEIDGREIARATAESDDRIQGMRQNFTRRGLAV